MVGPYRVHRPAVIRDDTIPIKLFASRLGLRMDHDVLDATGLEGEFDFHLEFSRDSATPGFPVQAADQPSGPSIFSALEEQLGLKLQLSKGTSQVVAIDRVERPSEN